MVSTRPHPDRRPDPAHPAGGPRAPRGVLRGPVAGLARTPGSMAPGAASRERGRSPLLRSGPRASRGPVAVPDDGRRADRRAPVPRAATSGEVEIAVAVADAWQRHGIGRALLEAAVDWAARTTSTGSSPEIRWSNPAILGAAAVDPSTAADHDRRTTARPRRSSRSAVGCRSPPDPETALLDRDTKSARAGWLARCARRLAGDDHRRRRVRRDVFGHASLEDRPSVPRPRDPITIVSNLPASAIFSISFAGIARRFDHLGLDAVLARGSRAPRAAAGHGRSGRPRGRPGDRPNGWG